jgi:peptide/nickel transport system permease protein
MTLPAGELESSVSTSVDTLGDSLSDTASPSGPSGDIEGRSLWNIALSRLRKDRIAMAGGVVAILLILIAVFAPLIAKAYGQVPNQTHYNLVSADNEFPFGTLGGLSFPHHLFGVTPVRGEDIFIELVYGARTSLIVGFAATALSLIFGVTFGILAGYYRGWSDTVISWVMDVLLSFPTLLFSIALLAIFNSVPSFLGLSGTPLRFGVIIFVLGFFGWPYIGRIVRGQVLSIREREFVDAARSLGASNFRILTREVLPNLVGPILVYSTLTVPNNILGEAGLSFLGVGFQPPTQSWGQMLSTAGGYFQRDPMFLFAPGVTIFIAVLAFNLFGDGLRDALDPKSIR